MVKITMKMIGNVKAIKVFKDLSGQGMEEIIGDALTDIAEIIIRDAKDNLATKGHGISGRLDSSIKIVEKTPRYIAIGTDLLQGKILELGRGPVLPVNAKVLHWVNKEGKDIYSKYSKPVEPDPWLEPALNVNQPQIENILANKLDQKVRRT